MRVISTNTGKTKSYEFNGVTIRSSMRRQPTLDGLAIHFDHIEGDTFAVTKHHGIKEAVVYAFSATVFVDLARVYSQDVTAGNVGENLTMDSLDESLVMIGDEYDIGTARLRATGPRYPCNRLNFCFSRANAMELFGRIRRPGVYFEVVREGHAVVGDELLLVRRAGGDISVLELFDGLTALKDWAAGCLHDEKIKPIVQRVLGSAFIPEYHRAKFRNAVDGVSEN